MAESVLYTVIPVVYFTGLMALGFRFNRRNRSRQEYFLARGDLGPATLGFSYSATQMSGSSYMGAVGTERELGYNFAPAGVSTAAAAWFTYVLLGERLRRLASRIRCTTIVDVFEARYRGKGVSMTATLLMLLAFIPLIAAQLKAAGNLFEVLLGGMPMARREVSQRRGVRLARWTTLVIGAVALVVAVDPPATILFIVTMSLSLMASAFTFPLLLGMWWPRATRAGGMAGIVGMVGRGSNPDGWSRPWLVAEVVEGKRDERGHRGVNSGDKHHRPVVRVDRPHAHERRDGAERRPQETGHEAIRNPSSGEGRNDNGNRNHECQVDCPVVDATATSTEGPANSGPKAHEVRQVGHDQGGHEDLGEGGGAVGGGCLGNLLGRVSGRVSEQAEGRGGGGADLGVEWTPSRLFDRGAEGGDVPAPRIHLRDRGRRQQDALNRQDPKQDVAGMWSLLHDT